jgi:hypothetical protein
MTACCATFKMSMATSLVMSIRKRAFRAPEIAACSWCRRDAHGDATRIADDAGPGNAPRHREVDDGVTGP